MSDDFLDPIGNLPSDLDNQSLNQNNMEIQSPIKNVMIESPTPDKTKNNFQNFNQQNGKNDSRNKISPQNAYDEVPISTMKQNDPPNLKPKSEVQMLVAFIEVLAAPFNKD